jgi:hypothetical protein
MGPTHVTLVGYFWTYGMVWNVRSFFNPKLEKLLEPPFFILFCFVLFLEFLKKGQPKVGT